jgi:hypothetical protein
MQVELEMESIPGYLARVLVSSQSKESDGKTDSLQNFASMFGDDVPASYVGVAFDQP